MGQGEGGGGERGRERGRGRKGEREGFGLPPSIRSGFFYNRLMYPDYTHPWTFFYADTLASHTLRIIYRRNTQRRHLSIRMTSVKKTSFQSHIVEQHKSY